MVRQHHHRNVWLIVAAACVSSALADQSVLPYRIMNGGIAEALSSTPGNARRGRSIAANAEQGNCLICHALPIPEAPVFGTVGPDLGGVGARLSAAQLRLRIVDPRALNPATSMPAYYKVAGLKRVAPRYSGQPMLSSQEIEDVIAYLQTLRS
jgi:sulfur-oxidizing protein SoxX